MGLIRVQRSVQTTLSKTFYVDEVPTDASGPVTVTVKRLDGTTVTSGTATLSSVGSGTYTFALPGQANVDTLTVDWSATIGGGPVTVRDIVEVVGGFYFGLTEARNELKLDAAKYPTATLALKRIEVEDECEGIRRQAQVPRFARFLLDGSGTDELVVPDMELRAVRAASVADHAGGAFTALTAAELAAVAALPAGVLVRDDGSVWPRGRRNVLVEYEYGLDQPSPGIAAAAKLRLQSRLGMTDTTVPYRAISFEAAEGGTYRLSTPSRDRTGIPEVDAAYQRGANERVWIA